MTDPAACVINALVTALHGQFSEAANPLGGGSNHVRFVAADAIPLFLWDAHNSERNEDCKEPFLWVRVVQRYQSKTFPTATLSPEPCATPPSIVLEAGIARCAVLDAEPTWAQYEEQAEISLDDSWRLQAAFCRATKIALDQECANQGATDAIKPWGPEGGVYAWWGTIYFQLQ